MKMRLSLCEEWRVTILQDRRGERPGHWSFLGLSHNYSVRGRYKKLPCIRVFLPGLTVNHKSQTL